MEHEMAMHQMRAHLARAGREIQAARQFLETPTGKRHQPRPSEDPRQRHGLHRRRYGHDPAKPERAGQLISSRTQEVATERTWRRFWG